MIASRDCGRRSRTLGWMAAWAVTSSCLVAGEVGASVPCDKAAETLRSAPAPQRLNTALDILKSQCQPLLPEILTAMRTRRWADQAPILPADRVVLLNAGIAQGYEDATAVSVSVLETGSWPGDEPLDAALGAKLAEGLGPVLDEYRVLLLLDIYEQVGLPEVRMGVLRALRQGSGPATLVPALDAYWSGSGEIQVLAAEIIAAQPEKKADAVLTRVAGELSDGAVLEWVARLANAHGVQAAVAAAKRG